MRYALETAGTYLAESVETAEAVRASHGDGAVEGSRYAQELASLEGRRYMHLLDVVTLVSFRLALVEDHLRVMATTVADRQSIFPMYTLARTVAEVSARAWWLLDPDVAADERAHRGFTERVYGWEEAGLLPSAEAVRVARARRRRLVRQAKADGMDVSRTKPPTASRLLEQLLGDTEDRKLGLFTYKLLSAFTHGTSYAIQQLVGDQRWASDVDGMIQVQIGTTARREASVLLMAFLPYMNAVSREMRYFGLPHGQLDGWLVYTSSELRSHAHGDARSGT